MHCGVVTIPAAGEALKGPLGGQEAPHKRAAPGLPKQPGTQNRDPLDGVNVGGQSAQSNKWSAETKPNNVTWQPTGPLPPRRLGSPVLPPVIYAPV